MDPHALSRRRLLQLGVGCTLGGLWRAEAARPKPTTDRKPIRACIFVFLYGGPSHLDTFDPKPDAPAEVRGEFATIPTSSPGVRVCEHLPHLARWMHKAAVIRSLRHEARLHDSGSIHVLTGRPLDGPDRELFAPLPQHFPCHGSAVAALRSGAKGEVPFASLPYTFHNVVPTPCQGAGLLGSAHDPLRVEVDPVARRYKAEVLERTADLDRPRREGRRALLDALQPPADTADAAVYDKAFRLLESESIRVALDVERELPKVRDRYGFTADGTTAGEVNGGGGEMGFARNMRGQNFLLARRLIEAGVPFVNVYDYRQQGQNWDAHARCADQHKKYLLPPFDRGLSALIEDLDDRGLLDSTLVVVTGEFGRTPRLNAGAGRDHWPDCSSVLLVGGGVNGGAVYGASDRIGAFPASDPVTPGDLAATVFARFGLDPATEIRDQAGRPYPLAAGEPLAKLFGG